MQNFPKPKLLDLFNYDYHFRMFVIFSIILILPVLFGWYMIFLTGWLLIWTLIIVFYRYFLINKVMKVGQEVSAIIANIWRVRRRRRLEPYEYIDNSVMEDLYVIEVNFNIGKLNFTEKNPVRYLHSMGSFKKGDEIEIIVNPMKTKNFLIKRIWVPKHYVHVPNIMENQ